MANEGLLPCPFCGGEAHVYGRAIREYADNKWMDTTRKEYWVQTFCFPWCPYGNAHIKAYGVVGGVCYTSEEAARKAWNERRIR